MTEVCKISSPMDMSLKNVDKFLVMVIYSNEHDEAVKLVDTSTEKYMI